ncbi:MAG: hypothetical protein AAEI08_01095 [Gammaproteobacteria bacterium]
MKKLPARFFVTCLVIAAGGFPVITPLQAQPNVDNMFISEDTDSFDPGLRVGERFPEILALYKGSEVTEIDQFIRDKGVIFLANRSVDW